MYLETILKFSLQKKKERRKGGREKEGRQEEKKGRMKEKKDRKKGERERGKERDRERRKSNLFYITWEI